MKRKCYVTVVRKGTNEVLGEDDVTVPEEVVSLNDLCKELVKKDALFPKLRGLASPELLVYNADDEGKPTKKLNKRMRLSELERKIEEDYPSIAVVADLAPGKWHLLPPSLLFYYANQIYPVFLLNCDAASTNFSSSDSATSSDSAISNDNGISSDKGDDN